MESVGKEKHYILNALSAHVLRKFVSKKKRKDEIVDFVVIEKIEHVKINGGCLYLPLSFGYQPTSPLMFPPSVSSSMDIDRLIQMKLSAKLGKLASVLYV